MNIIHEDVRIKDKKYIVYALLISILAFVLRIITGSNPFFSTIDVVLLFGLFTKWVNSEKVRKYYKILFIFLAIIVLFDEGILKNEGGHNASTFGAMLLVKILSGIVIFKYLKKF